MFNKKFALLLTTIHAYMIAVSAALMVVYALWSAGNFYDFAGSLGFFIGVILVSFVYLSIWYIAIYLMRRAIEQK